MVEKVPDYQVVEKTEPVEEKSPGLWASFCLILVAVARNIETAGIVEMTNMFRMFFRSFLATIIMVGFGYLLFRIAMIVESDTVELNRFVGVILGYIAGILTMAAGFYFGGQDRSKKPEEVEPKPLRIGAET